MTLTTQAARRATIAGLETAVHRGKALSKAGLLERAFTLAFRGLVYPQIWEDPVVDMAALAIRPDDHVVTIASGGCNALSYLTIANPAAKNIASRAIDLNGAHVRARSASRLCALTHLPDDHASLPALLRRCGCRRQPGRLPPPRAAASRRDVVRRLLERPTQLGSAPHRGVLAEQLLPLRAARHVHRLGPLFWAGSTAAIRPRFLAARSLEEQRTIFEAKIAPVFDKGFALWLSRQPASLFGLGIPPAQYRKLAADRPGGIAAVLRHRLERLACDFDMCSQNYFAWQAFGRRYDTTARRRAAALPAAPPLRGDPLCACRPCRLPPDGDDGHFSARSPRPASIAWSCSTRRTG